MNYMNELTDGGEHASGGNSNSNKGARERIKSNGRAIDGAGVLASL